MPEEAPVTIAQPPELIEYPGPDFLSRKYPQIEALLQFLFPLQRRRDMMRGRNACRSFPTP
jgi:hypothetical protein